MEVAGRTFLDFMLVKLLGGGKKHEWGKGWDFLYNWNY